MLVNLPDVMIIQFGSLTIIWSENTAIQVIFENKLFFWVRFLFLNKEK
jgi:hypothetical protein